MNSFSKKPPIAIAHDANIRLVWEVLHFAVIANVTYVFRNCNCVYRGNVWKQNLHDFCPLIVTHQFTNKWIVWLRAPMGQFTLLIVDLLFHYRGIRWPYFIPGALAFHFWLALTGKMFLSTLEILPKYNYTWTKRPASDLTPILETSVWVFLK